MPDGCVRYLSIEISRVSKAAKADHLFAGLAAMVPARLR